MKYTQSRHEKVHCTFFFIKCGIYFDYNNSQN